MESTLASVDLGRYRRFVQMIWDPEPTNDGCTNLPVWCLGQRYDLAGDQPGTSGPDSSSVGTSPSSSHMRTTGEHPHAPESEGPGTAAATNAASPGITSSTTQEAHDSDKIDQVVNNSGWPAGFLDDFESRLWMTYRSDFEPISKSDDPRASSALSLTMRIRSQLAHQNGFTSDTGWGCMVRSGQSLLANTMIFLTMGRGMPESDTQLMRHGQHLTEYQTGAGETTRIMKG